MPSYSSSSTGLRRILREAFALYKMKMRAPSAQIDHLLSDAEGFDVLLTQITEDLPRPWNILEVGPGNALVQAYYFARQNTVTTIDLDVIAIGIKPWQYLSMLRHNGPRRLAKTVIRKFLGVDHRNRMYLRRSLGLARMPAVQFVRGDVCQLPFANETFDVVFCRSVLQVLREPRIALNEISRVLKPRGAAIANLHLYTSHNGSLDPRVILDGYDESLMWAHLRGQTTREFLGNVFLNRLRLNDWRKLFTDAWPGCEIRTEPSSRLGTEDAAKRLLACKDLSGYSIEELTTHTVLALWKKPLCGHRENRGQGARTL